MELGWGRENMTVYEQTSPPTILIITPVTGSNVDIVGLIPENESIWADNAETGWASNSFLVLQPNICYKVLL